MYKTTKIKKRIKKIFYVQNKTQKLRSITMLQNIDHLFWFYFFLKNYI